MKVYIPKRYYPAVVGFFGTTSEAHRDDPVNLDLVRKYFTVVDNPDEADFAIVFMTSPNSGTGYDKSDREKGGNGYMPISLQYNDYTATYARNPSLAGEIRLRISRTVLIKVSPVKQLISRICFLFWRQRLK